MKGPRTGNNRKIIPCFRDQKKAKKKRRRRRRRGNHCLRCCNFTIDITTHHVLPQRFFQGAGPKIPLCERCHRELEGLLPQYPRLEKFEYFAITQAWLAGKGDKQLVVLRGVIEQLNGVLNPVSIAEAMSA